MSARVLVAADGAGKLEALRGAVSADAREVLAAASLDEAWRLFKDDPPAVVILDWDLADKKAAAFCAKLRGHKTGAAAALLVFVEPGDAAQTERGFAAKADAVLPRPLDPRRLRLWVEAVDRRAKRGEEAGGVLRAEGLVIDPRRRTVACGDFLADDLTQKEFDLLCALVRRRPGVLSKEYIMGTVWRTVMRDNTVEVHVKNLRAKLGPAAARVVTVPKAGYRFE
ncbi:MAG: winged helix-turn-helix domain-containing protein [Elusimicrobia bacterium]|nr:winged helix-turn-helix domain-containing protein [Elusimicrobiota bacterium]